MVLIVRFIISSIAIVAFPVLSYQVVPMYHSLEIVGNKSRASYQITNTRPKEALVEIKVLKVELVGNDERLTPADSEFLLLPPQLQIAPGRRQTVRMRYLGNAEISKTNIYRVVFSEVKTQDREVTSGGVDLLLEFSTVVFVSPNECSFNVRSWVKDDKVHFSNIGNCVVDLSRLDYEFTNEEDDVRAYWHEINTTNLSGYLVPGRDKVLTLSSDYMEYDNIVVSER